jgi:hypothetical protein
LHGSVSSCLFGRDESRKAGHVGKVIAGVFGVGVDLDAVLFWIARPSSSASTESRPRPSPNRVCSLANVAGVDVFQAQGIDDQGFDFVLKAV